MRRLLALAVLLVGCDPSLTDEPSTAATTGADTGEPEPEPQCDPLSQRSFCDAGEVVECGADGLFEVTNCGTRAACAEGSDGADCVWRLGEACETDAPPTCWDPGGILRCEDGFWSFEGCEADARCKGEFGDAACIPNSQADCEFSIFESRCEGDALVECGVFGVETTTVCAPGTRCAPALNGAACVADDAVECDPDTFETQCSGENVVLGCDANTGWSVQTECNGPDRCLPSTIGAFCLPPEIDTCDPDKVEPTCTDGVARGCSSLALTYEEVCTVDQRCGIDQSWFFDGERRAGCIPLDAEPCTEPSDILCDGDTLNLCIDGALLGGIECPGCTEDPDELTCN